MADETSWEGEINMAVDSNDVALAKSILSRDEVRQNGDLGRKEWKGEKTFPLHQAVLLGDASMVRAMVDAGIDVNSYRTYGPDHRMTALHRAVVYDKEDIVTLLLDLGADPTLEGQWLGHYALGTPLGWARQKVPDRHGKVLRILEEREAWLTFQSLDPLSKLLQKPKKRLDLGEGKRVRKEISEKEERKRVLQRDLEGLGEEAERVRKAMAEKRVLVEEVEEEVRGLKQEPSYRNLDLLETQLREIEMIEKSLKEIFKDDKEESKACPVCSELQLGGREIVEEMQVVGIDCVD